MPRPREKDLVKRAQAGDRDAARELLEVHEAAVFRFGRRLCPGEAEAQDAAQDALLTALDRLGEFRGEASFSSWLYTIVRSRCARSRVHAARSAPVDDDTLPSNEAHAEERFSAAELHRIVEASVDDLTPEAREVLLLRDMEGLPGDEVARALGLTVAAMKSRLHRARKQLRDRVEGRLATASPAAPKSVAALADIVRERVRGTLSSEICAHLEARLAAMGDPSDEAVVLQRVLMSCAVLGDAAVPEAVRDSVRAALDRWLARAAR